MIGIQIHGTRNRKANKDRKDANKASSHGNGAMKYSIGQESILPIVHEVIIHRQPRNHSGNTQIYLLFVDVAVLAAQDLVRYE
jgi:hypothetical protein